MGFVRPAGEGEHFPASGPVDPERAPGEGIEVVAVAADAEGPFARVSLRLGEEQIPLEEWGRYFFRASVPSRESGTLWLTAERATGETLRASLALQRVEPSDR